MIEHIKASVLDLWVVIKPMVIEAMVIKAMVIEVVLVEVVLVDDCDAAVVTNRIWHDRWAFWHHVMHVMWIVLVKRVCLTSMLVMCEQWFDQHVAMWSVVQSMDRTSRSAPVFVA